MGHLTSFEHDGHFQLVPFLQKFNSVRNLELVVMRINVQTELDLLDLLRLIVPLLILHLLFLFIAQFAEIHDPADRILEVPEEIGKRLQELSCPHCAVPFPPYTFPASEEEVVNLAKKINQSAQVLRRFGVTLSYHNHSQEFQHFNGKRMLDIIYANAPDIQAELDTFWVQRGGDNPERWIRRFPGRTDVLHIKDYGIVPPNEIVMCPIGDGNLDWDVLLTAAEQCGVKYYVVEHDGDCADPFESFAASMRFLKGNFVS